MKHQPENLASHRAKPENKGGKLALPYPKKGKKKIIKNCKDNMLGFYRMVTCGTLYWLEESHPGVFSTSRGYKMTGGDSGKSHLLRRNGICMTT